MHYLSLLIEILKCCEIESYRIFHASMILVLLVVYLAPITTLISPIVFIYISKFEGILSCIFITLFLLIFGILVNAQLIILLALTFMNLNLFATLVDISRAVEIALFIDDLLPEPDFILVMVCFSIIIISLYGILGYACRKWRNKNNIPLNSVFEKDIIVIMIIFLLLNIWWFLI